jgi:hypothetical protein
MPYDESPPIPPSPEDGDASRRPTVVVASSMALSLATGRVEHPSIPEGSVGFGTFIDDHLLGRQAMSEETIPAYEALLAVPRRLAYVAYGKEDGSVEGQLAALVKPSEIAELRRATEEEGREEEPWRSSVPSWEPDETEANAGDAGAPPSDEEHVALLPLGIVVRMAQRRVHPDDLAAEAADVLQTVVNEGAVEIVDQFLDTL